MTNREPSYPAASSPVVADLARDHCADCLYSSLVERLHLDNRTHWAHAVEQSPGCGLQAGSMAGALVTRLRLDGAEQLAEALASRMSDAGVAPVFSTPVALDELKEYPDAVRLLELLLRRRLTSDGHPELAKAVAELFVRDAQRMYPSSGQESRTMTPAERDAFFTEFNLRPLTDDELAHYRRLARAHDARTLLVALLVRLRQDGNHIEAGHLMSSWLHEVTGPLVDARKVANALIERLREPPSVPPHLVGWIRNDPRPDLADALEDLLGDAPIDRDPDDIWRSWLDEVAGPLIQTGPLAAALVDALRLPGHAEHAWLADAVEALMKSAQPPVLPPGPPPSRAAR